MWQRRVWHMKAYLHRPNSHNESACPCSQPVFRVQESRRGLCRNHGDEMGQLSCLGQSNTFFIRRNIEDTLRICNQEPPVWEDALLHPKGRQNLEPAPQKKAPVKAGADVCWCTMIDEATLAAAFICGRASKWAQNDLPPPTVALEISKPWMPWMPCPLHIWTQLNH
jgi:hypothetical protein